MDLAFVDRLAKVKNRVLFLLFRQYVFERMVGAKGMKLKDSKETDKIFPEMVTKNNRPTKIWVDQGTKSAGDFEKFCVVEGIHVYFTLSETKARFVERAIRSLKNILYRYMEEHGYKYIQKFSQLVSQLKIIISRKTRTINVGANKVKKFDFMSIFYGNQ